MKTLNEKLAEAVKAGLLTIPEVLAISAALQVAKRRWSLDDTIEFGTLAKEFVEQIR